MRAVNLIPAEQRGSAAVGVGRSQGGAYAVLVLLAGVAVIALLYGAAHRQIASRRAQAASLSAQAQRAQAEANQLAPYTSFIAVREQRMQAVADLVASRFDWAHVFHEFGRVLPVQTSIDSLTGTIGSTTAARSAPATSAGSASAASSAAVTSATPPGSVPTFTLAGCATSQRVVALMLERLRLIDGVSEASLQSSTKTASSSADGGCPTGDPAFSVVVNFDPLPSASAITASTKTVSEATSGAAAAAGATSSGATR